MSDPLSTIAEQLRHFTHEETVALVVDFLSTLDERQQKAFLGLVDQGPRPLVAEALGLDSADDLLEAIEELHEAIAADAYVEYGVGFDPDYGAHRGFGDDSWIDEMDDLFAAATSLFRAGQFLAAYEAYLALFDIFELSEDGFHFTRPDPAAALRTDLNTVKQNLFIALSRSEPEPVLEAIDLSEQLCYYGANRYALLDAWQGRADLMIGLEQALIERARRPTDQKYGFLSHPSDLLREFFHRYRTTPDYESLCRQVGPLQGWPYVELVNGYRELAVWKQVVAWTEDGLHKLPPESCFRPQLQEAQGEALLHLDRPAEALDTLLALFQQRPGSTSVYLKLRQAAQAVGRWQTLYPQLIGDAQAHVLGTNWQQGYPTGVIAQAELVGYALLLEGDWQQALAWASNRAIPSGWGEIDLQRTVAAGLVLLGLAAKGTRPDTVLARALQEASTLLREHGSLLEPVAGALPGDSLLDGAVQLYEQMVERAIGGRSRASYAKAGAVCQVIRAIRRQQAREADFQRYTDGLFSTYSRYPALKDELRKALM